MFVFFFVPETKKVSLEEMDVLFGGTNHVEKGGDLLHIEDVHHANVGIDNATNDQVSDGVELDDQAAPQTKE